MKPKSLSASAVSTYETCSARYLAEYIERTPDLSGDAASLGSAVHAVLEVFVAKGGTTWDDIVALWETSFYHFFSSKTTRYDEGLGLLRRWFDRWDTTGRTVLSTEVKETFPLPTSQGDLPITYIFDRCDERDDGTIEVVDYKTVGLPIQPEDLKGRIQPRVYALAAAIKYPKRPAYWVSYDLLRYDVVGVRFTREDNLETWNYLKAVAERIYADDGTAETLNAECRWCVRKGTCEALTQNAMAGGTMSVMEPEKAADRRAVLQYARDALNAQITDLDRFLLEHCEAEGIDGFKTPTTEVKVSVRSSREIDTDMVARIIGPDLMARYSKLGITAVDDILKNGGLTSEQKAQIKQLIRKKSTSPFIKTTGITHFSQDD